MKKAIKTLLLVIVAIVLVGCGRKPGTGTTNVVQDGLPASGSTVQDSVPKPEEEIAAIDARDTIKVPNWLSGEDSIAYIENMLCQSPISVETFLSLAETHNLEYNLHNFNKKEPDGPWEEDGDSTQFIATRQDSCALKLANRIIRMYRLAVDKGDAMDRLRWAIAVNAAIDTFCVEMPDVPRDSALKDISRVMNKFVDMVQSDWDYVAYVSSVLDNYQTFESYRLWLDDLSDNLKPLAQEEYEAWYQLNEERFVFWRDISSEQGQNSMKGSLQEVYYGCLVENRKAELAIERDIVINGKPYRQLGKAVTSQQWEKWLAEKSVPEDIERCKEEGWDIPDAAMVKEEAEKLRTAYNRWGAARQAFAAALPQTQRESYEHLTSDIQSRFVGKLPWLIPYKD